MDGIVLDLEDVGIGEDSSPPDDVEFFIEQGFLDILVRGVADDFELVDVRRASPVVRVALKEDLVGRPVCLVLRGVPEGACARDGCDANAVDRFLNIDAIDGAPVDMAGIGRERVCLRPTHKRVRRDHPRGPNQCELVEVRLMLEVGPHHKCHLVLARPILSVGPHPVPTVLDFRQRLGEDVIEVELGHSAVPLSPIVEGDALPQHEAVRVSTNVVGNDRPSFCEGGHDFAIVAEGHETLEDPIVAEEFVRAVNVSVHGPDRVEESAARAGADGDNFFSRRNAQTMDWIIVLLKTGGVPL
mmetsp:Transcript_14374/g.42151  ORF Transcript_14374/g.42151 Transcript_14374/m.42151 type:complete len:300 (+) Transcript_14374:548-1447(+)